MGYTTAVENLKKIQGKNRLSPAAQNLKKIPEFYREVVKCWNLSGGGQTKSPVTFIDIRKQII